MENKILHVEDNPDDITLTALAFRKAGVKAVLEVAPDGERAMAILKDAAALEQLACVLLDVKLPSVSGLEVLAWLRGIPALKRLPVIMLTSSLLPGDINRAYDLGANSYLVKPPDLDSLIGLAKTIDLYWLQTNTRPMAQPATGL
ncbi:MAG TPA: response regulator [Verrucomicrobiae bacterium]|nr:response regulator [Verrucomicrobiae bacterium]